MDLVLIFKLAAAFLTGLNIVYGWLKLRNRQTKITVSISLLFFYFSVWVMKEGETVAEQWIRHFLFYTGQIFSYFYLTHLIATSNQEETPKPKEDKPNLAPVVVAGMTPITLKDWINFLTAQGIQHVLTAPIFFLTISRVRVELMSIINHSLSLAVRLLITSLSFLVLMHLQEFLVYSQRIIPLPDEIADPLEIGWYLVAMVIFFSSWRYVSASQHETKHR